MRIEQAISVREAAKRYRVSTAKIREFIRRGLLGAVDVGANGRSCWRITPEACQEFDERMAVKPRAKRTKTIRVDAEIEAIINGADQRL